MCDGPVTPFVPMLEPIRSAPGRNLLTCRRAAIAAVHPSKHGRSEMITATGFKTSGQFPETPALPT